MELIRNEKGQFVKGQKTRKRNPMLGTQYGEFTVISEEIELTNDNKVKFKVKCSCGKEQTVRAYFLETGRQTTCKECISRKNYNIAKESGKKVGFIKPTHEGIGNFTKTTYSYIKNCAARRNIFWSEELTIEYLWKLLQKQEFKCIYTGLPIQLTEKRKMSNVDFSDMTASLDRIDSSKEYTKDNIQWVHKNINFMKNNFTEEEFLNLCKLVYLYDNQQPSSQSEKVQRLPEQ